MSTDNEYICSRCSHKFNFCPEPVETEETVRVEVKCPKCGSGYVRRLFTFPRGYSSKPHG